MTEDLQDKIESMTSKYETRLKIMKNLQENYELVWKFNDDNLARIELLAFEEEKIRNSKINQESYVDHVIRRRLNNLYEFVSSRNWDKSEVNKSLWSVFSILAGEGLLTDDFYSRTTFKEYFCTNDKERPFEIIVKKLAMQPRIINGKLCDYLLHTPNEEVLDNFVQSFCRYALDVDDEKEEDGTDLLYSMHKLDFEIRCVDVLPLQLNSIWKYEGNSKK